MKSRSERMIEYEQEYGEIPRDYRERLLYLYDKLKLDDVLSEQIIQMRDNLIQSTYYTVIRMILYEIPVFTPRPRARMSLRSKLKAGAGPREFIQIYSPHARENKNYIGLFAQEHLSEELDHLLCTPCDIEFRAYFPTPKYYTKAQIFLAEIGADRPIIKPDFDNIEKSYADAFTGNIWFDDIVVLDASFKKYYSVLPRMEIDLKYANQVFNYHQYKTITKRKDFPEGATLHYFGR